MFDVVVAGGELIDGLAPTPLRADVGVRDGRVTAIGRLADSVAAQRIDATGRLVMPGFVDAHSHADAAVLDLATQLAALRQGVTTLVCGQDGLSFAPATPAATAFVTRYFAAINGRHPDLDGGDVSVAALGAAWSGRTAVNVAYLVPHGMVRFCVLGGVERPADPDELIAMTRLVEAGLADGAVGLSSGLEYLPGRFAGVDELAALCRPVASARLPYVTHMRGYGPHAPRGLAEARAITAASGVDLHVSHLHGPADVVRPLLGDDLTFDSYPYRRGCTILAMAALPRWLDDTDLDRATAELAQPDVRRRVVAGLDPSLFPRVTLAHVPHPDWAWAEGRTLARAAQTAALEPGELLVEVLIATGLAASGVIENPPTTDEASVRALLRHPAHMGGSDGILIGGHPHPRAWGAFARFLREHVIALGDWTWPEAVDHLATRPARRFGLTDRGLLRPGSAADIVVLDPARIADRATYDHPRQLAEGVDDVIVNGVPALVGGALADERPGMFVRPHPGR